MPNVSIPALDSARMAWMLTFSAAMTATPALYGITAGDASSIDAAVDAANAAFLTGGSTNRIPNNPATKTSVTTAAKDAAMNSALSLCRSFAVTIQANDGVSDADKIAAGIVPRNFTRTPIFVPNTSPLLGIQFAGPGSHTLAYADSTTPALKAKPAGAVGIQIYAAIGVAPVETPGTALYYGTFTTNPVVVAYEEADNKKVATLFGRWIGRRGDLGPWSLPESMVIAF